MKKQGILLLFLFFSSLLYCQEIPQLQKLPDNINKDEESFIIKMIPIRPALSNLAPEVPIMERFHVIEVNFDSPDLNPKEINIAKLAMEDKQEKQSRIITLDAPIKLAKEPKTFSFSAHPNEEYNFSTHSFVPKFPSNTTQNSVYQDAGINTGAFYLNSYSPFYRRYSY